MGFVVFICLLLVIYSPLILKLILQSKTPAKVEMDTGKSWMNRIRSGPFILKTLGFLLLAGALVSALFAVHCYRNVVSAKSEIAQAQEGYEVWKESGRHMSLGEYFRFDTRNSHYSVVFNTSDVYKYLSLTLILGFPGYMILREGYRRA